VALLYYPLLCNYGTRTTTVTTTTTTTTFILVRNRYTVPLILNLGRRQKCLVTMLSWALLPFQSTPVPIQHKAGWAPESGSILQRRKKYLVLARIQTPDHPAHNLVTVLNTTSRLNIASYQIITNY
jgi:hypothetical protein